MENRIYEVSIPAATPILLYILFIEKMNRWISNNILKHYDTISFDIFDTLVEREVCRPSDIFRIAGREVLGAEQEDTFCRKRIIAEQIARERKENHEVVLDNIYEELLEEYGSKCSVLKDAEIDLEIRLCHKKKAIFPFYRACIAKGKRIFLVSDMYLPSEIIRSMLNKCGIDQYNALYVSGEYGRNKISGELFQVLLRDNQIEGSQMIHIGDSIKADFVGAHKAGIKAVLVGRKNRLGRLIHS